MDITLFTILTIFRLKHRKNAYVTCSEKWEFRSINSISGFQWILIVEEFIYHYVETENFYLQ